MRKYYQAALALTAVVSLVSLLIYRHEYNKLRYVLEVFNYFGTRKADVNCTNYNSTFSTNSQKYDEPIPSWQRLEDDLYVYSAYNIHYQTYKEIRAIGLGTVNSISNVQCLIFFENESKPILGYFNFVPIGRFTSNVEGLKYRGYHFICAYSSNEIPTGITFVTKSNKYLNYAPIFPIKTQPRSLGDSNRIRVCVMQSSMKPMQSIDMIGFVTFHALVGMDNFIVYDTGIPNEFNTKLKEMANDPMSSRRLTYKVVPWNFPFIEIDQNVIREIAITDCLYRTYNNFAYAIPLSWNEYVVPKYHRTTIDLMIDIKKIEPSADCYKFKTATFCMQQADNEKYKNSTLTALKKTKSNANIEEDHSVYIYQPHQIILAELQNYHKINSKNIGQNLVAVNQYKYCDNDKVHEETEDVTIFKFAQDMQDSWIFKQYHES